MLRPREARCDESWTGHSATQALPWSQLYMSLIFSQEAVYYIARVMYLPAILQQLSQTTLGLVPAHFLHNLYDMAFM